MFFLGGMERTGAGCENRQHIDEIVKALGKPSGDITNANGT